MPAWITPPQYAKSRGIKSDRVLAWIRSGELRAVNFGDGVRRPRWKISPEAIAEFEQARTNPGKIAIPARRPRRHAAAVSDVIEFY